MLGLEYFLRNGGDCLCGGGEDRRGGGLEFDLQEEGLFPDLVGLLETGLK